MHVAPKRLGFGRNRHLQVFSAVIAPSGAFLRSFNPPGGRDELYVPWSPSLLAQKAESIEARKGPGDLTTLNRLNLSQNPITDAGLVHLRGLTELRELNVQLTQVTDAGVAKLQKALPKCKITTNRNSFMPGP